MLQKTNTTGFGSYPRVEWFFFCEWAADGFYADELLLYGYIQEVWRHVFWFVQHIAEYTLGSQLGIREEIKVSVVRQERRGYNVMAQYREGKSNINWVRT